MDPNTIYHFAWLAYDQKMQPIVQDDESEPFTWWQRLAMSLLLVLGKLASAIENRRKEKQSLPTPLSNAQRTD